MLIIKNMLKKHDVNNFLFVKYFKDGEEVVSFVVQIDPMDAYDLLNKKLIANFGYYYKKPLTEFVAINADKISALKAVKLAKPHLTKFKVFCEEQEELDKSKYRKDYSEETEEKDIKIG